MKNLFVIALIPYFVIGHAEFKDPPKLFLKKPDLNTLGNTFNTLVKNTKTTSVTTNATIVEVLIPITSDIDILNVSDGTTTDGYTFAEIDFSTINSTMITSVTTIVVTSSTSSKTLLQLDIITGSITNNMSETVLSKLTAAPVTELKLKVILASTDIDFGTIQVSNSNSSIEALADKNSPIQEIVTKSQTKKRSISMDIVMCTDYCDFSSTSSTIASTISSSVNTIAFTEGYTSASTSVGVETTPIKDKSTTEAVTIANPSTIKPMFTTSELPYSTLTSIKANVTSSRHTAVSSSVSPSAGYCDSEYSCVDCSTARVCAPTPGAAGLWEVTQFSCPDYAPWCDSHSGTCSTVRTPECDLPVVGNFTCMRSGLFPDPDSCADYYLCDDDVPLQFTCVYPSPYYSAVSHTCVNSSSHCVDYPSLCEDKSGLKVNVPQVDSLFLYCVDGSVQVVDRCIGAYRFRFEQQRCVPECPYAGLFPSDDDCAGYYRCSPSPVGDQYDMTQLTCPQGMAFSEPVYDCIDRSLVANCNNSYIS